MIDKLWLELTARIPWRVLIRILKNKNIPTAISKDETKAKIDLYCSVGIANEQNFKSLILDLEKYSIAGDKVIRIIQFSETEFSRISELIRDMAAPESIYVDAYPYLITHEELDQLETEGSYVTKVVNHENDKKIIVASKRYLRKRENLVEKLISLNLQEFVQDYQEIIGVHAVSAQLIDILHFDLIGKYLIIRVDNSKFRMLSKTDTAHSFEIIERFLYDVLEIERIEYLNLYPSMNRLYSETNALIKGRVIEYGFQTTTSSSKHEKMRRANTDLRTEDYHVGGKTAVPDISPYKMGIRWEKPNFFNHEYELGIPGTEGILNDVVPIVNEAYIFQCIDETDFRFIIKRILNT